MTIRSRFRCDQPRKLLTTYLWGCSQLMSATRHHAISQSYNKHTSEDCAKELLLLPVPTAAKSTIDVPVMLSLSAGVIYTPSNHHLLRKLLLLPVPTAAKSTIDVPVMLSLSAGVIYTAMAELHGANDIRASSQVDIPRRWRRGSPWNVFLWDRALFCLMVYAMGRTVAAPLGAVGNAPVGTSLCRCEPSVSLPDLNGDSVSGSKRGRTRQHQTIQPWGTYEWKSPEEIEAWEATQSAVAGISSKLGQVAVEEGPHSDGEAELDIGGPEFTELETQPLPVHPDPSAFLYERYIQNAEIEQRIREERLEGSRRRIRERRNGAAAERRDIIRPQPRDAAGRFIRRRVHREERGGKRKSTDYNRWLVLQWLTLCVATADIPTGCTEGTINH
ncbi:hypothetical protein OUZ56_014378 [Daphnia magna]|uniref:Uncharacterized protein n=1 Tax=Daphnia magna TaxID=35525 RepID=A0ABR0AJZ3_9CRUS|nr:hypothetical protein OUZ56_014378 [Daphnia magna]